VACVIGEGGSGGALGIAVADQVAVMEHAYYSVISPEGCAAILWKSGDQAPEAAEALRLTAKDLKRLGIIDAIVPEPLGAAHRDPEKAAKELETWIARSLRDSKRLKIETLLRRRSERLRNIGSFFQSTTTPPESKAAKPAKTRTRRRQSNGAREAATARARDST
jgi:acetyl-CoA carboxylase carboxyl transferase subunit alpha